MLLMTCTSESETRADALRDAARAMESAPRTPPSIATLLHAIGIFPPIWLKRARIGYTEAARATVTARYPATIKKIDWESPSRLVSNPMRRNATEFPMNAAICQKIRTASLTSCLMVALMITLPKYSPTTVTAIRPDAPSPLARTYDPYTAETVRIISAILSSTARLTLLAA